MNRSFLFLLASLVAIGCSDNLPIDPGPGTDTSTGVAEVYYTHRFARDSFEIRAIRTDGSGMRTVIPTNARLTDVRGGRMLWGDWGSQTLFSGMLDGATPIAIPGVGSWPVLSPNGASIAYVATVGSGREDLFVVPSGGGTARTIMTDVDHETIPAWSPDGARIAIHRADEALCVVDVVTGFVAVLDDDAFGYGDSWAHIDWSRDGQKLAYLGRHEPGSFATDVFTIRLDGTGRTRVTNDTLDEFFPHWTYEGGPIVFGAQDVMGVHLLKAAVDGSGRTDLTARFGDSGAALFPRLSSDGRKLLYVGFNEDWDVAPGTLYLLDIVSGSRTRLAADAMDGFWKSGGSY